MSSCSFSVNVAGAMEFSDFNRYSDFRSTTSIVKLGIPIFVHVSDQNKFWPQRPIDYKRLARRSHVEADSYVYRYFSWDLDRFNRATGDPRKEWGDCTNGDFYQGYLRESIAMTDENNPKFRALSPFL